VTLEVVPDLQKRLGIHPAQTASSPPTTANGTNNTAPPPAVPKNYHVNLVSQPSGSVLIFSEHPETGAAVAIEGTVQYEFNITPELNEDYRAIMRARRQQAETKTRSTQMLDVSADLHAVSAVSQRFMNTDTVLQRQKVVYVATICRLLIVFA
jgi:hypothetical protein